MIRKLSSDSDGEVVATVHAMRRVLETAGSDIHELAEHIECTNGNGVTEAEMQRVFDAGYAQGVQDTENRYQGADDFRSADGKPNWQTVALFLQRNKARLDTRHHEFIDDMSARAPWHREPTERQHRYLHSLFFKLGGKIT